MATFVKEKGNMDSTWWQESVVYQVYWRSFFDTNGDGYGDLKGVTEKLDYIQSLGVQIIWLNPFYASPDVDNGYDISDYCSVMDKAGTMADFDELLHEVHKRKMKLIMDMVVNHTSDQHPWFIESRSSKDSPKRDWYIWKDGKDDNAPNNWRSYFTQSAWEFDPHTGQYYFHSFAVEQPDLNWENPDVRNEIYKAMRFWLDKGIDGYRMDVINLLAKKQGFPDTDNPGDISYLGNNPGIHEYLQEMRDKVFRHYDMFTVGEIPFVSPEDGLLYVGEDRKELHSLFHFEVADDMPTWDMKRFKRIQQRWYDGLWGKGWNSQFLNNHDHTRQVTRYGNDGKFRVQSAKLLGTLIHTLPGIPYIYQGEEIGMTGIRYASIDEYNDIAMKNKFHEEVAKGKNPENVLESLQLLSRDNSRTPIQWDDSNQAGFTRGTPWIKVNPNYTEINVKKALEDKDSVFYYYQSLIQLRKSYKALIYGSYKDLSTNDEHVYGYVREFEGERILILLNFSDDPTALQLPDEWNLVKVRLLLGNYENQPSNAKVPTQLLPHQAGIYLID